MSRRPLIGTFRPPGDKSVSHRVALFSLLSEGSCSVGNYSHCADCASTLAAVALLGGGVAGEGGALRLRGAGGRLVAEADIDCGNSGTTMRMLQGILAGRRGVYRLRGDESLSRRPMERVAAPLRRMGAGVETTDGHAPVIVRGGPLTAIDYALPVASAQLKSALLLAGIQAAGTTRLREPAPSRDHSERLLTAWGARLWRDEQGALCIAPGALRMESLVAIPGDTSGAAFFACGAALVPGSDVVARDVLLNPSRTGWLEVLRRMGAAVECQAASEHPEPMGTIHVVHRGTLRGTEVPAGEIPNLVDEVPILAVAATQAVGTTVFREAAELRVKECDRLAAMEKELTRLGADIEVRGDTLVVRGPTPLRAPAEACESYGDHRIAMALRIASLLCDAPVEIRDEACAAVSYPNFAQTLTGLLAQEDP
ncbi:MAG: 3-phosphoshikimate 1-carboxyvinyltransferase [Lentisphaeria bacterium]|nr:3-phosphoshikimate 1-carboxyvinyltransferase [Lentisphaeria bacterium]